MVKDELLVTMTKSEFKNWLIEEIQLVKPKHEKPDFEAEKITKQQAAEMLNKSIPTLNKLIQNGILKVYGVGMRGKFLLRSEVLNAAKISNL